MVRERTADMVSSVHPSIPVSNCGEKKANKQKTEIRRKAYGKHVYAWEAKWAWEIWFSHLLNMLLEELLQILDVIHSQTRHLGHNVVIRLFKHKTSKVHLVFQLWLWILNNSYKMNLWTQPIDSGVKYKKAHLHLFKHSFRSVGSSWDEMIFPRISILKRK